MGKRLSILLSALLSLPSVAASDDENWDSSFGVPGSNLGGVSAITSAGTTVFFGGNFTEIGGISASNVAKWDGTNWSPLGAGVGGFVSSIVFAGGYLYVAGSIHEAGGIPATNIARWDGTNWLEVGAGLNSVVFALASDGQNIYAGGHFTSAGEVPASKIAKWDGTNWTALGAGIIPVNDGGDVVGAVDSLAVNGSEVFAGGRFRNAGGLAATNIARWDGATWHSLGEGLRLRNGAGPENGAVRSLLFHRGSLYAGGSFRLAGVVAATNIARWDGGSWSSIGHADNTVGSLVPHGGGLFAGGSFHRIGGVNARIVAHWNGSNWSELGTGILGGAINGGLASTGTELLVGGSFSTAGGKRSTNIALWHIPHSLAISRTENEVTLSWLASGTNFILETKDEIAGTNWQHVPQTPVILDDQLVVTNEISAGAEFYRLRRR